jgi:hypothetical protein
MLLMISEVNETNNERPGPRYLHGNRNLIVMTKVKTWSKALIEWETEETTTLEDCRHNQENQQEKRE